MKKENQTKNIFIAVEHALYAHRLTIPSSFIKDGLSGHPEFPSVAAISDCLLEWQIPNIAARISSEQLREVPLPALVHLDVHNGIFASIRKIDDNMVQWLDPERGWREETFESFVQRWNGVTLIIEPNEESFRYAEKAKKFHKPDNVWRTPLVLSGLVLALFLALNIILPRSAEVSPLLNFLTSVNCVGLLISLILLWQSIDPGNAFVNKFCSLGTLANCTDLLQSKAAYVTKWLSWAEVGYFYFAGGAIIGLCGIVLGMDEVKDALIIMNLVSLPFTAYSVYYQLFVARRACLLCTSVLIVLWVEFFGIATMYDQAIWSARIVNIDLLILSYLLPIVVWALMKDSFRMVKEYSAIKYYFRKIKFSSGVFNSIFGDAKPMPPLMEGMHTIKVGNPAAEHVLTIVTNPQCTPCASMHKDINDLLMFSDHVRCEFILIGGSPASLRVASKIFSASDPGERLLSWYQDIFQDYDKWNKKYPEAMISKENVAQLKLHERWSRIAGVRSTPSLFFNGVQVPEMYSVSDFKYVHYLSKESVNFST